MDQKVIQKLATIGVAEGTIKEDVATATPPTEPMEVYKKFEALTGKEKITFFQKNEKVILKAMRTIHYCPIDVVKSNLRTV